MARNHKFFFDADGTPRARGPAAEQLLMIFLETDVQGSDHVCHDLMDDLVAIEDGSDDSREFVGNAHRVTMDGEGVLIERLEADAADTAAGDGTVRYRTGLKHFREVLEDWEAFILDEDTSLLDDDYA